MLFGILGLRQLELPLVEGPRLDADARNPRHSDIVIGRGSILARDGSALALTRGDRRVYPLGTAGAHAVGYASAVYGTSGLEAAFDPVLSPQLETGPIAELRSLLAGAGSTQRGNDVVTTLDVTIQRALTGALAGHARGAGIVLDPRTGEVLALASVPAFDPNALAQDWDRLRSDPESPLLDRSTNGLYPPGSTFKIVTAADALAAGVVTPASTFVDRGGLRVGSYTVHNDEGEVTGTQDLAGAFALSSNVDFASIALELGVDRWYDDAARWRLGEPMDFDLPAALDRLPAKADVSPSILAQLGFGQASLLVTPLRMALIAATIAADGQTPRPYLVRSVAGNSANYATRPEVLAAPIDAATADEVRDLMIAVVRRGTGTSAALPGVTVAGKTGTATNPLGPPHSWFVAFAPAEAPRVAAAVVIENAGYGAAVAAPIVREVLRVALARTRT